MMFAISKLQNISNNNFVIVKKRTQIDSKCVIMQAILNTVINFSQNLVIESSTEGTS